MEGTPWGELSLAGILMVLVLREVFSFLKTRPNGSGHADSWALETAKSVGSMTTEVRKLNHAIANLSQVLQSLSGDVKATKSHVKEVRKDIDEMNRRSA